MASALWNVSLQPGFNPILRTDAYWGILLLTLAMNSGVLCLENIDGPVCSETFILGTLRPPGRTRS